MTKQSREEKRKVKPEPASLNTTPANADAVSANAEMASRQARVLNNRLGLNQTAFKKLTAGARSDFLALIASGAKTAALAVRILNAVHRTSPGRQSEVAQKLKAYPGSLVVLEDFLNRLGIDDPFIATERAQVLVLPVSALPEGAVITSGEGPAGRKRSKETVRGASGHLITGMIYSAFDKDSPSDTVGFFSKRQAVARPFETFNPEKFKAQRRSIQEQRCGNYRQVLKELDLFDLETDPDKAKAIRSPILARDLAVYAELRTAIADFKHQYQSLLYAGQMQPRVIEALNVRTDVGGTFMGWFERQIAAGSVFPEGIRIAFESLRDPDVYLEPSVERDYVRGLIAYQKAHSFIEKEAALSGAQSDLEEFDRLSPSDPLRLSPALEQARHTLQQLSRAEGGELRLSEFSAVVSSGGLSEFRRRMNERALAPFEVEFSQALNHLRGLFMKDGRWMEDSIGDSVPLGRLSQTLYGARIGAKVYKCRKDEKRAPLTHSDFKCVRDGLFVQSVSGTDRTRLLLSMPIAQFREMVEGVICACRKARFLDQKLEEYQAEQAAKGKPALQVDKMNVGAALDDWNPILPLGGDVRPEETFMENEGDSLPLKEVMARVEALGLDDRALEGDRLAVHAQAKAGIYSSKHEETLKALEARARAFRPAVEFTKEILTVKEMMDSPLASPVSHTLRDILTRSYLSRTEALELTDAAQFKAEFDRLRLGLSERTKKLAEKIRGMTFARIFTGGFSGRGAERTLEVAGTSFGEFAGEKKLHGFSYYEPELLESKLAELDKNFTCTIRLSEEWLRDLKALCTQRSDQAGPRAAVRTDNNTYYAVQSLTRSRSQYVARSLVVSFGSAPKIAARPTIGPSYHFRWENRGNERVAVFGFGKYHDEPVSDVVERMLKSSRASKLWYFTHYIPTQDFPSHAKEIAAKVVQLASGRRFNREEFHRWLTQKFGE